MQHPVLFTLFIASLKIGVVSLIFLAKRAYEKGHTPAPVSISSKVYRIGGNKN